MSYLKRTGTLLQFPRRAKYCTRSLLCSSKLSLLVPRTLMVNQLFLPLLKGVTPYNDSFFIFIRVSPINGAVFLLTSHDFVFKQQQISINWCSRLSSKTDLIEGFLYIGVIKTQSQKRSKTYSHRAKNLHICLAPIIFRSVFISFFI